MSAGASGGERAELRAQLTLAIPLAAQQIGFQLMGSVDAALLGRHSDAALAAAGVGNNLLFAVTSIGLGVVMGLDSVIPRALGAGDRDAARRYLHAGLRLAVLIGLAGTLVVLATPLLLVVADVPAEVASDARVYIYLRAIGITPFLISVAYRSYLAAHGVTRPLIIAVIAGNVVNFGLDAVLIFGVPSLGIPALGIVGAALATVTINALIPLLYVASIRRLDRTPHRPSPDEAATASTRDDLARVARYGAPVGGQMFAEVGIFGVATVLAANLGTLPAAAHTIALNIASFTFSVAVGIGAATSVRVGLAIGGGDVALARRRGLVGLALGLGLMAVFAAVFVFGARPLAYAFTDDPAVIEAAVPLLMIAALFQLSDGAQAIAAGALRGLGDTRATLIGNLVGHYGVGLGVSLTLTYALDLGAVGLWWGLSAGLTTTALFLALRFARRTAQNSDWNPA